MTLLPPPSTTFAMPRRTFLMAAAATSLLPGALRAHTPQRGGHLVLGIDQASTTDKLDPAYYFSSYHYSVGGQIFDTLTDLGPDGRVVPALAESWEARKAAAQWVFTLRKGVTFHNGKALTPEDVIYSLNHHRGETSESAGKGYLLGVADIRKTGPNEVTVDLSGPDADFPYLVADIHFVITPEGEDFNKGIGTGAFILESFEPGVRALTRRNPGYWTTEKGFVESVETLAYNDRSARQAGLLSGALHYVNDVDPRLVDRLAGNKDIALIKEPDSYLALFAGRADVGPFANPDVRLALKHAIQRDQALSAVFNGAGTVSHDNPLFPSNRYFSADLPRHDYDPEKALFHWKKSGVTDPLVLSVTDGVTFPGAVEVAQLYQASANAAGIPLEIDKVPADGYWSDVWMKKSFVSSIWSNRPTADALLSLVYHSSSTWNETFWKNATFDQLITEARGELDEARRRQLYHDAQLLIAEENSSVIPVYGAGIVGISARIEGYAPIPGQIAPRVASTVWFA